MTACRDKAQFDYADRLPSPQELAKLEPVLNLSLPERRAVRTAPIIFKELAPSPLEILESF